VVVTGAAMGIGRATAAAFAEEGATVVLADVAVQEGSSAAGEIEAGGGRALFVEADVALSVSARQVIQKAVEQFGGVDVLINNVGIQPSESFERAENLAEEVWDRVMAVNVKSHFLMAKYAIPEMRKRGGGVIINVASVQGLQSTHLVPAYAASKGAILSFTRNLALDYARENIRVLTICPGSTDTPLLQRVVGGAIGEAAREKLDEFGPKHPIPRVGTPEEIADVMVFLASSKASYMTGEWVCVDGGLMAKGAWCE
jgi:NAD(P)-dependent dehydrogenase (short-subunit alcohol dehydrogenase family)